MASSASGMGRLIDWMVRNSPVSTRVGVKPLDEYDACPSSEGPQQATGLR